MVLSTSSRASSISSIVNQSQGGGNKKAGLPPNHTAATNVAFAMRGYQQTVAFMADTSRSSAGSASVCGSRSVGMIVSVGRMKC
jgi:hypothetical protein